MNSTELVMREMDMTRSLAPSPGGRRVLGLLQEKGCAYQVRGAWRFRGLRSHVQRSTIDALLANGLAERVETDRCSEIHITPAGREVRSEREGATARSCSRNGAAGSV